MCFLAYYVISYVLSSICPVGPQSLTYLLSFSLNKKVSNCHTNKCTREPGFEECQRRVQRCETWPTSVQDIVSEIWGKTVRASDKAALPKSTGTGLQQTWSIYSFPGQMETIKSEARQPSLYQFFTLSTHKLQKWQAPCFLQGKTHAMNFYQPNSHPYAWLTHRAMFFMLQPPVQLHELYRSEATGHCRSFARQEIRT